MFSSTNEVMMEGNGNSCSFLSISLLTPSGLLVSGSASSAQFIHVLAPVQDDVVGIVAAWLRHSVTSQTPETENSDSDY